MSSILKRVGTIVIPATTTKFVAKERFVVNTSPDALMKINRLGDDFIKWFLGGDGKIENPTGEQTLCYHELLQRSVSGQIITELGDEAKAEVALSGVSYLIERQNYSQDRVLMGNFDANTFYVKDKVGVLRMVSVAWFLDGWYVGANSVKGSYRWGAGCRVFSLNSDLKSSEPLASAV